MNSVEATAESADTPPDFNFLAGITAGQPIITLPIKLHLQNPMLGPSCYIGSDANPIVVHPENTDLSKAQADDRRAAQVASGLVSHLITQTMKDRNAAMTVE